MPTICKNADCKSRASYALKGMPREFCAKHKTPEMINVVQNTCIIDECNIRPMFDIKEKERIVQNINWME